MRRSAGFTLIEILAVVAIIAILTAILFPVFSRAKDSAYRSDDMSAMNQLRTSLMLYYTDQGGYPPALLGYATLYASGPEMGNVIPADRLKSYLYPKRVGSLGVFQPAYNRFPNNGRTTAVYPNRDARALGAPIADLNGDNIVDAGDDVCGTRQAFGPGDGMVMPGGGVTANVAQAAYFYTMSGYDVAEVPDTAEALPPCTASPQYTGTNGNRFELRYALFWTDFALNQNGNAADDPRQLGYGFPPDDTIVTWNSYFRNYRDDRVPEAQNRDIVLYLGGSAKTFSSKVLFDRSWRSQVAPGYVNQQGTGSGGATTEP